MVEDMITLLESAVQPELRMGKYPDRKVARRVSDVDPGLYHYDPYRNVLAALGAVDTATFDMDAFDAATMQPEMSARSSVALLLSASFWRSRFKYGQRAVRFALMEAGHLAQNLLLVATAHGLATRAIGGFLDDEMTALLVDHNGVDDAPLYTLLVGTPDEPDR